MLDESGERNVTIVYSGGDDVFLVGSWNEVLCAFVDLKNNFKKFTQNTLTISGGIGLYQSGFPVNIMAKEVEMLEDAAKCIDGKNAISLFETKMTFSWERFLDKVISEKFTTIRNFFDISDSRGKAFLYNILELVRNDYEIELDDKKKKDKLNIARLVYLISRMEPDSVAKTEQREAYKQFAARLYNWSTGSVNDKQELIIAIYLYVYLTRERKQTDDNK